MPLGWEVLFTLAATHWAWTALFDIKLKSECTQSVLKMCIVVTFIEFSNTVALFLSSGLSLLKKKLWHRCFPVNFANFFGTPILQNIFARLLLNIMSTKKSFYAMGSWNSWFNSFIIHLENGKSISSERTKFLSKESFQFIAKTKWFSVSFNTYIWVNYPSRFC